MNWPAQSANLNFIELVWDELDGRQKAHLWELQQQSGEKLSEEYLVSN